MSFKEGDMVYYSAWDELDEHLGVVSSVTENQVVVKLTDTLDPTYVTAQEFEVRHYGETDYCD
jgi:hypothetical protein